MNPLGDTLMALAERRLGWLETRQRVLAQNIANADTPRYQPNEVQDFGRLLAGRDVSLARTHAEHIAPPAGAPRVLADQSVTERTPDGNAVSLEQQALKMAETDNAHALALNIYRRYAALYRTALGRNG